MLAARARLPRRRQLPRLHGRGRGRAGAGRLLRPQADRGHEGQHRHRPGRLGAPDGDGAAPRRPARAGGRARPDQPPLGLGRADGGGGEPLPRAGAARPRLVAPRDGRPARRLHPVRAVRARLPRGPGQRRDRNGLPGPQCRPGLRPGRPDGALDLRRLRRVRPGLPDRRLDAVLRGGAGDRPRLARGRPQGRQRLPLLRGRLPDHLQHPRRRDRVRPGPRGAGEREPALREGPLRLRLRQEPAAAW
jgi:hypothetical protein